MGVSSPPPPLAHNLLVPGWNLLAAEVHNCHNTSSDLGFDLELAATTVLTEAPALHVSPSGTTVTLAWPDYASAFALYSATNLLTPVWDLVADEATQSNGAWIMKLPASDVGQCFFRLQAQ